MGQVITLGQQDIDATIAELRALAPHFVRDIRSSLTAVANELERASANDLGSLRKQTRFRIALDRAHRQLQFARASEGTPGVAAPQFRAGGKGGEGSEP